MLNWIRALFHLHEWVTTSEAYLVEDGFKHPIGKIIYQKCKVCGDIRRKVLS